MHSTGGILSAEILRRTVNSPTLECVNFSLADKSRDAHRSPWVPTAQVQRGQRQLDQPGAQI